MNRNAPIRLRRTPAVRIVEHPGGVAVYPEPHTLPVLPKGWAPLGPIEQSALLEACDTNPSACRLRLGSLWDARSEYRVYCLEGQWAGACAATIFDTDYEVALSRGRNTRLLGVAVSVGRAVRLAIDFLNWDLQADGAPWRLSVLPGGDSPHRPRLASNE